MVGINQNNIISLSGGKDSTAMLLMMLERNETIHSVVFFDTGWEFPQMYDHIDKLQKYIDMKIWRLHSTLPFDYWLTSRPIKSKIDRPEIGIKKGDVHRIGNGWPSPSRRWCTRQKVNALNMFLKPIPNAISCVGYAADEKDRGFSDDKIKHRFPLQEYGMTEPDCLEYCYQHGFDWDGLYNIFRRVSCFCCPLQRIEELRSLRRHYSELWQRMKDMENQIGWRGQRGFHEYKTVHDLDRRFADDDRQMEFGEVVNA